MKNKYLTTKDVAILLGFTPEYVRQLAREGKLEAIKPFGNRLLFPVEQFEYQNLSNNLKKGGNDE